MKINPDDYRDFENGMNGLQKTVDRLLAAKKVSTEKTVKVMNNI